MTRSTHPGAHVYDMLRSTLAKVRAGLAPEVALPLERVETILTRLIVDDRDLPQLRAQREAGLRALAGAAGARADAAAVKLDFDYYTAYEAAALAEFKTAAEQTKRQNTVAESADDFDVPALEDWMRREFPLETELRVVSHRVASRGFSKRTELVELAGVKHLPASMALRIDQEFNYLGTRVTDEYPALRYLYDHGVRLARPLALEATGAVLGQPFIVSAKVGGATIGNLYAFPPRDEAVIADMARCLADLHRVPTEKFPALQATAGRLHLDAEIDKYYADWRALDLDDPSIETAFRWIKQHRELGRGPPAVVHNDYGFNNILIDGSRVQAVVDWEFVHIGVAAADVGYFFYSAEHVASYEFFLAKYREAGGVQPSQEAIDFYRLWGQLRLAVMGWQVEVGFNQGEFSDVRFGFSGAITLRKAMLRVTSLLLGVLATYA